jgi:N-succinyldiaminopimelate aminotransferase
LPILREVMPVDMPEAAFYLWPQVDNDERFTRQLFERQHITVLPGSYIAREMPDGNPGRQRVRISLVATVPECIQAAARIREFMLGRGR